MSSSIITSHASHFAGSIKQRCKNDNKCCSQKRGWHWLSSSLSRGRWTEKDKEISMNEVDLAISRKLEREPRVKILGSLFSTAHTSGDGNRRNDHVSIRLFTVAWSRTSSAQFFEPRLTNQTKMQRISKTRAEKYLRYGIRCFWHGRASP